MLYRKCFLYSVPRAFLERCLERYRANRQSGTTFQLKDHLWALLLYEKGLLRQPEGERVTDGCNCARNHLTILPDGDVYACRRMSSRVGNVNTDDLYELWTTKMEAYRAVEKFDKCSRCPLKYICRGCPAVAYGYTHDMYAADPQCWREVA